MELQDIRKKLEALTEAAKLKFNAPSVSVAVTVNGQDFYYSTGFADVEKEVLADAGSVYGIASSSKAFAATALCILAQENKLCLDDPVKKHLPDFAMFDSYMTENMTIRDALSHRTGLPRHDLTWFNSGEDLTIYDTVKMLEFMPPAFKPRYRMHYQNHMFALATVLTEKISGMPWQEFFKKRIFDPLEMTETYATGDMLADESPSKARPYASKDGNYIRLPYRYIKGLGSCGAIYSTVRDLIKWSKFNLNGNDEILAKQYLDDLHMPQMVIKPGNFSATDLSPEVDLTAYGLGWFIESYRGHKMVHHGGTIDGFKSIVGMFPNDNIGFAVLSNLNGNQSPMAIAYGVADMLLGLAPVDWCEKIGREMDKQKEAMSSNFEKNMEYAQKHKTDCPYAEDYAGSYRHPAYGLVDFTYDNGSLFLNIMDKKIPAIFLGNDQFSPVSETLPDYPSLFVPFFFERDEKNQISAVNLRLEEAISEPIKFLKC